MKWWEKKRSWINDSWWQTANKSNIKNILLCSRKPGQAAGQWGGGGGHVLNGSCPYPPPTTTAAVVASVNSWLALCSRFFVRVCDGLQTHTDQEHVNISPEQKTSLPASTVFSLCSTLRHQHVQRFVVIMELLLLCLTRSGVLEKPVVWFLAHSSGFYWASSVFHSLDLV